MELREATRKNQKVRDFDQPANGEQATADVPAWEKGALARGDGRRRLAAVREMFPVDPTVPLFDRPARPFAQLAGAVTPFEAAKVMEAASGRAFEKTQTLRVRS
ncbi:MAG: hypothetical protein AAFX94_25055, partial [Myxococcota bacterium]